MHKRDFLRTLGGASLSALFAPELLGRYAAMPALALAEDEAFWTALRAKYALVPDYINLESGYYSMQAQPVLDAYVGHLRALNAAHSRYMRTARVADREKITARLAGLAGCGTDELIVTRNTTESLDTVIGGLEWKAGDEAVMAGTDYGAMLDQFKLVERRYGVVRKVVDVPLHPRSDDEIVAVYANAITPRTKLLMVCHVINITGQVLPVRKIADMAHARGVDVLVDGAHAFAQLDYRIPDTGADYYGASLHKWLGAPLGSGILYVRKGKVKGLWPLFGESAFADDDIRKLNHIGTHPPHTDLAIGDAIDFHESIGVARKEARLKYLRDYWLAKVRGTPRLVLNTPADPARGCAIANVGVEGVAPRDLMNTLFDRYRIWTVGINTPPVRGVRVTPHLFTTTAELDALVKALVEIARG
jgi:selenocysteine lyase/cysteine desulfurase